MTAKHNEEIEQWRLKLENVREKAKKEQASAELRLRVLVKEHLLRTLVKEQASAELRLSAHACWQG